MDDQRDGTLGRWGCWGGCVLPLDEVFVDRGNTNAWRVDSGDHGGTLGAPTNYLVPCYMGLYFGLIDFERRLRARSLLFLGA